MPPMLPAVTGVLGNSGWFGLSLVPLFVMGLTFFRYNAVDPESRPIDVKQVFNFVGLISTIEGGGGSTLWGGGFSSAHYIQDLRIPV